MAVTISPHSFTKKDNEAFICIQITPDMVRSIGESLSFISESITGPSATDTFTKRENTALIYNRRDTARESVTTQISTEYILFVSLFNNSKNGIAYRFFLIS